jgi:hypothetical protein
MFKKLTTALGFILMSSSLALAAQAPAANSNQAAPKTGTAQAAPSGSPQQHATASKSAKRHNKKHHKRNLGSNVTPKGSTPKQ